LIALGIIQDGLRFRFTQVKLGAHLLNLRRLLFQFCFESLNFLFHILSNQSKLTFAVRINFPLVTEGDRFERKLELLECLFSFPGILREISPACRGNLQQARTGGIEFRTVFLIVHAQLRNA
jgi:hypothetical protein